MDQTQLLVLVVILLVGAVILAYRFGYRARNAKPTNDLWADEQRRDEIRREENRRPYDVDAIPPALRELTIVHYHYGYRDEEYAAVYLMPDRFPLPPLKTLAADLFTPYWNLHTKAIWSWRADNVTDHLTSASLMSAAKERSKLMLDKLTADGWTVSGRDAFSLNLWVIYLSR